MDIDVSQLATKADLKTLELNVFGKFESIDKRFESADKKFVSIDNRFESIDKRFESIDKRFESLHQEIVETRRTLALEIVKTQADLRQVKETMATKDDIERIITAVDKFAGKSQNYDRAATLHGQAITEMQVKLKDHDSRIKRLES